ncbi:hypothetical protein ACFL27_11310 [candidate division CSSED10-310 bacterium]|uniref:Glycosyltransferase RgtA/B/C/D-like domain-containing protein n=1 Tax=candidate division CSSED10-310 bacterium TaxID=2855610 RepID=A0ABV6YXH6_UNCC1
MNLKHLTPSKTDYIRRTKTLPDVVALSLFMMVSLLFFKPWHGIGRDDNDYYVQATSLILDGDLFLANDHVMTVNHPPVVEENLGSRLRPNGHIKTVFALGPALMWTPGIAVSALYLRLTGRPQIEIRKDFITRLLISFTSLVWGSLLFWVLVTLGGEVAQLLGVTISRQMQVVTAGITIICSPVFVYLFSVPTMPHSLSTLWVSLFMLHFIRMWIRGPAVSRSLILSSLFGLMCLVRWQNLLYFPMLLTMICVSLRSKELFRHGTSRIRYLGANVVIILLFISPQLAVWRIWYEQWLLVPQGEGFINWTSPVIRATLFSSDHGLLVWTPLMMMLPIGFILKLKRLPGLAISSLVVIVSMTYLNMCVLDWHASWSYSNRRFSSLTPLLLVSIMMTLSTFIATPAGRKQSWGTVLKRYLLLFSGVFFVFYNFILHRLFWVCGDPLSSLLKLWQSGFMWEQWYLDIGPHCRRFVENLPFELLRSYFWDSLKTETTLSRWTIVVLFMVIAPSLFWLMRQVSLWRPQEGLTKTLLLVSAIPMILLSLFILHRDQAIRANWSEDFRILQQIVTSPDQGSVVTTFDPSTLKLDSPVFVQILSQVALKAERTGDLARALRLWRELEYVYSVKSAPYVAHKIHVLYSRSVRLKSEKK